jgi:adenylate cyclase
VPIEVGDGRVGAVYGKQAGAAATLLGFAYQRERERRSVVAETLDRYKEITLLYDVAERLAACLDVVEVAQTVLSEALKFLGGTGGVVFLVDHRVKRLQVVWAEGDEFQHSHDVDMHNGVIGRVFSTGRAEVVDDVSTDPDCAHFDSGTRALICAPLRSGDETVGLLRITHDQPAMWSAGHLKLVNSLAAHAASAIDSALLHQRRMREQQLDSELDRHLSPRLHQAVHAGAQDEVEVAVVYADLRELSGMYEAESGTDGTTDVGFDAIAAIAVAELLGEGGAVNRVAGDKLVGVFTADACAVRAVRCATVAAGRVNRRRVLSSSGFGVALGRASRTDPKALRQTIAAATALHGLSTGSRVVVDAAIRARLDGSCQFEPAVAKQAFGHGIEGYEVHE